ncbi:Phosphatidylcholine translocator ABCB4 [Taenia solium]|eukprot:TsM_001239500 transcript=TsM_001239500 gene=TsM_001239500
MKKGGRTCLVVAHRLTTVEVCDLVVVLERGKAVLCWRRRGRTMLYTARRLLMGFSHVGDVAACRRIRLAEVDGKKARGRSTRPSALLQK